jgi:hypothetical protein
MGNAGNTEKDWGKSRGCLAFSVQIGPFARLDEARPIVGMPQFGVLEHLPLYLPQCFTSPFSLDQPSIIAGHQSPCLSIGDRPQADDLRL